MLHVLILAAAVSHGPATALRAPPSLTVGSLVLRLCPDAPTYYCGSIRRPLDPSGEVGGTLSIGFTYFRHTDPAAAGHGTIVAAEGGPGDPSGASRNGYRTLFGRLLRDHDMVLMDDRGTGRSGAIDCEPLQHAPIVALGDVTRCGRSLGAKADLYGTGLAADDLNALLDALGIRSADLYGDSYGTFFVQTFAARHPTRVRTVTLDGAYPARGDDPWYPSYGATMRSAFETVCRRSPACAALPGSSLSRIEHLLAILRRPKSRITPSQLAFLMDSAGLNLLAYRELDAAGRAYAGGDTAPLQRLIDEAYRYEERPSGTVYDHSQGLFAAASCQDNPQVYDMRLAPAQRERAWQRALARERRSNPEMFSPFTIDEFLGIPLDFAYVPLCQSWPVASAKHPAGTAIPPGVRVPNVPALVLTGDLDTITTPSEGDAAAAQFQRARRVIVANSGHVTAVGDVNDCASRIVRSFISSDTVDAACASAIPPLRLIPNFATSISAMHAARATDGNKASLEELRAAADAVFAANDALARASNFRETTGAGLRGGRFDAFARDAGITLQLHNVRWSSDLPVSGTATMDGATGNVRASLRICGAARGTIVVTWRAFGGASVATIDGTIDRMSVRAIMTAP